MLRRTITSSLVLVFFLFGSLSSHSDDYFYVRGDGAGSDSYAGTNWATAFATLDKAHESVQFGTTTYIYVQATESGEAGTYDGTQRSNGYSNEAHDGSLTIQWEGGYTGIESSPTQTGVSVISDTDGTVDETGITLTANGHGDPKNISINRFHITNVTHGVYLDQTAGSDASHNILTMQDCLIKAHDDAIRIFYAKTYTIGSGYGGRAQLRAKDITLQGGTDGSGSGVRIIGIYGGSYITASSNQASSITASDRGIDVNARSDETHTFAFTNTVIYDCGSEGIYMDARSADTSAWYRVQATLRKCTIADNGDDGLRIATTKSGSSASVMDSILYQNSGLGLHLGDAGYANFTCSENHNAFYLDPVVINGTTQTVDSSTILSHPIIVEQRTKPYPYYRLAHNGSPCANSASDGGNRGAYQEPPPLQGTVIRFR